ncbi:ANTAR domain-containing response regulator [Paenibacillus sp. 2TAB26]|uniref:ANTAR domain-containing response regulator n=1 Tax=Paenibacillus sp. 2TAB26 TaxID=3233005 RepID=UPI003F97FC59
MRSLLVVERPLAAGVEAVSRKEQIPKDQTPKYRLTDYGYHVISTNDAKKAIQQLSSAEAIILHLPLNETKAWSEVLLKQRALPLLWWCSTPIASLSTAFCEDDVSIDGLLTATMSEQELHWALHFASKQCFERQQWQNERKQLESRLEERKWIDMAKGILCKIKNISEAEAYDVLRKQAMNERKRMVDVATSIVKVYQILQDSK